MVWRVPGKLRRAQQGVSLVVAVFILVVLSLLGAAMINVLSGGTDSVAREVLSARALFVAESGAQRMLSDIFPPGGATNSAACTNAPGYNWPGIIGCSSVSTSFTCSGVTVNSVYYVTITSTGSCGPSGNPAARTVEVQARDGL